MAEQNPRLDAAKTEVVPPFIVYTATLEAVADGLLKAHSVPSYADSDELSIPVSFLPALQLPCDSPEYGEFLAEGDLEETARIPYESSTAEGGRWVVRSHGWGYFPDPDTVVVLKPQGLAAGAIVEKAMHLLCSALLPKHGLEVDFTNFVFKGICESTQVPGLRGEDPSQIVEMIPAFRKSIAWIRWAIPSLAG